MKIDRLLAIIMVLINKRRVQAKELADMFDVSVRTIYRDIEAINQSGIPIVTYQGTNGGIGITDGYKLDKNVLTNNEMESVIVALKSMASSYHGLNTLSVIEKIKGIISDKESEDFKARTESIFIDFSPWGNDSRLKQEVETLKSAIHASQMVSFIYCNAKGEEKRREVEPHTLVLKGQKWYLYAYCTEKKAFRLFKLARMKNVTVDQTTFHRREFNLEEMPWDSSWKTPPGIIKLVLRFDPEVRMVAEEWFGVESIQQDENGRSIVTTLIPEDHWFYGFILSLGSHVEVLEPQHIKEKIKNIAAEIYSLYELH